MELAKMPTKMPNDVKDEMLNINGLLTRLEAVTSVALERTNLIVKTVGVPEDKIPAHVMGPLGDDHSVSIRLSDLLSYQNYICDLLFCINMTFGYGDCADYDLNVTSVSRGGKING